MNTKIYGLSILLFALSLTSVKAQNEGNTTEISTSNVQSETQSELDTESSAIQETGLKAGKLKKLGDGYFTEGNYHEAINSYQKAIQATSKKKLLAYLNNQCGEASFALRDYSSAKAYYLQTVEKDNKNKKFPKAVYKLGDSYKHLAEYDEAKENFQKFISLAEKNKKVADLKSRARLEEKGCDFALELVVDTPLFKIYELGETINGPYSDAGPEIRQNSLVFSKINSSETKADHSDFYSKLYSADKTKDSYAYAQKFATNLEMENSYIGNPSFSKDGQSMYFSVCSWLNAETTNCAIYSSSLQNGIWTEARKLDNNINEEGSSSSYPQIVVDENGKELLYFSAERARGRGAKDIWVAEKLEDGSFAKAKNLGYPINTKYDEVSPFYHSQSRTLYYSTNGEISLGGLDVYKAVKVDEEEWSEPVNMETPVNSSLDDYDFVLDSRGDYGYLVSNREGTISQTSSTCCDDIFEVRSTSISLFLSSLVYEETGEGRTLASKATLELENLQNGEKLNWEFTGVKKIVPLEMESKYVLKASHENFEALSLEFNTLNLNSSDTLNYDLFLNDKKSMDQKIIGTVYYEYNSSNLTQSAPEVLLEVLNFLKANENYHVEVIAHTDDKGTEDYNMQLSKFRSKAAAKYLISEGIAETRIKNLWFGETQPIAPNTNEDGSDNIEGRALNRRTEFKLLEITKED
ncbi:MAG: OmpA family protein [Chitinophagales bacterium]|nr:OmpA family protein [Chitinophagales bacterium]